MSHPALAFDVLDCFDRLKTAGMPEAQARVQAEVLREQGELCVGEIRRAIEKYDALKRAELATRGDVRDVQLEIEKVRAEVEKVRAELKVDIEKVRSELKTDIEKVRSELKTDIEKVRGEVEKVRSEVEKVRAEFKVDIEKVRGEVEKVKFDLLKWQLAGWGVLAAIMARGFNWIGF